MKSYSFLLTESLNKNINQLLSKCPYMYHVTSKTAFDKYINHEGLKCKNSKDILKNINPDILKDSSLIPGIYLSTTLNRLHIGLFKDKQQYKSKIPQGTIIQIDTKKLDKNSLIGDIDYVRYVLNKIPESIKDIPTIDQLKEYLIPSIKHLQTLIYLKSIKPSSFTYICDYTENDYINNPNSVWQSKYKLNRTPTKEFIKKHPKLFNDIIKYHV